VISAVAVRPAISNTLSTAPDRFEPIYRRKPNRARPCCWGFYAAMQLRMSAWAPLPNTGDINYGLFLLIFVHSVDDPGHLPCSDQRGRDHKTLLRKAYTDMSAVVEAMRQYWMPIRYGSDAWLAFDVCLKRLRSITNTPSAAARGICSSVGACRLRGADALRARQSSVF
jgi:hypothetical protein